MTRFSGLRSRMRSRFSHAEANVQAISKTEARVHYERYAEKAKQGEAIAVYQASFIESVAESQACRRATRHLVEEEA